MILLLHNPLGNPRCPVASFLKYLSKLNPMNLYLWQRPKASFKHHACEDDPIWYENAAVGHNSLGEMMTNMSKLAQLSRIYTNNCIRGTYVSILDSLVEDYPLITTLVSLPTAPRFQHILPREPCDERPTMVPVTGKYISSSEQMLSSRRSETPVGSPPFNVVQNREQPHLTKVIISSNHSQSQPSKCSPPTSIRTSLSQGNSHDVEKQTDPSPASSPTDPAPGLRYHSGHRGQHTSFVAYRLSQLQAASSHNLRNQLQASFKTTASSYSFSQTSVARAGNNHTGLANSRVVYCQTVPAMASSSSPSSSSHSMVSRSSAFGSQIQHSYDQATTSPLPLHLPPQNKIQKSHGMIIEHDIFRKTLKLIKT